MGRGGKERTVHRGGEGFEGHGARGSNDDRWDPTTLEDDPFRDLRAHDDDQDDTVNDEYLWPQYEEEDED